MATTVTIGGPDTGDLFIADDAAFRMELLDKDGVPEDMTGMTIVFDVRPRDDSPESARLLFKTADITGTYDADRTANTQRAVVVVSKTEMTPFRGSNLPGDKAKQYRHSWKRIDDGSNKVFSRGDFLPEKATAS